MPTDYVVTSDSTTIWTAYLLTDGDTLSMNDEDVTIHAVESDAIRAIGADIAIEIAAGRLRGLNGINLSSDYGDEKHFVELGEDADIAVSNAGIFSDSDRAEIYNHGAIQAERIGIVGHKGTHEGNDDRPLAERYTVANYGSILVTTQDFPARMRGVDLQAESVYVYNTGLISIAQEPNASQDFVTVEIQTFSDDVRTVLRNTSTGKIIVGDGGVAVSAHNTSRGQAKVVNEGMINSDVDVDQLDNSGRIYGRVEIDGTWAKNSGMIDGHIYLTNRNGAVFDATDATARIVIDGSAEGDRINGSAYDDRIYSKQGRDVIIAGDGDDYVSAHDGRDNVVGGAGDDEIHGGKDNDMLAGNEDNDTLYGDGGNDTLQGVSGDDELIGGDNDDLLTGGEGSDTLNGGSGNDRLIVGWEGDDQLTGGSGNDVFVFYDTAEGEHIIVDFGGSDRIDLSLIDGISGFGEVEDALRQHGNHVILDLEALGGAGEVLIANTSLSELTSGDFILS